MNSTQPMCSTVQLRRLLDVGISEFSEGSVNAARAQMLMLMKTPGDGEGSVSVLMWVRVKTEPQVSLKCRRTCGRWQSGSSWSWAVILTPSFTCWKFIFLSRFVGSLSPGSAVSCVLSYFSKSFMQPRDRYYLHVPAWLIPLPLMIKDSGHKVNMYRCYWLLEQDHLFSCWLTK